MRQNSPVFGKRNAPRPAAAPVAKMAASASDALDEIPAEQATFFAAVRSELGQSEEARRLVVPWSFKAATLAGLVVGCALAGFDVTNQAADGRFRVVAGLFGLQVDQRWLLPAMLALGLFAGARVSAMIVLGVHAVLGWAGETGHVAYLLGGAAASVAFSAAMLAVAGHPPAHGFLVELMAGAGAGLCYRAVAGARPAGAKEGAPEQVEV